MRAVGSNGDWDVVADNLILLTDALGDGLYYVVENFNPIDAPYMPLDAQERYNKGEILGQAVYARYRTFGRALEALTKGCYKNGLKPIMLI